MSSPANFKKHPIHPMLIPFPIGFWVLSLICDIIGLINGDPQWSDFARFCIGAGIIAALVAAIPGAVDLFSMKASKTRKIGIWHMSLNLLITTIYILGYLWRGQADSAAVGPVVLSAVAVALLVVSGWLGGEMVYVHGVAVDKGAENN